MNQAAPTLSLDACLSSKDVKALHEYIVQLSAYYRDQSAKVADAMKISEGDVCRYSGDVGDAIRKQP